MYEIELINKAFIKCYGLKDLCIVGNIDAINELSYQTGLSVNFLKKLDFKQI